MKQKVNKINQEFRDYLYDNTAFICTKTNLFESVINEPDNFDSILAGQTIRKTDKTLFDFIELLSPVFLECMSFIERNNTIPHLWLLKKEQLLRDMVGIIEMNNKRNETKIQDLLKITEPKEIFCVVLSMLYESDMSLIASNDKSGTLFSESTEQNYQFLINDINERFLLYRYLFYIWNEDYKKPEFDRHEVGRFFNELEEKMSFYKKDFDNSEENVRDIIADGIVKVLTNLKSSDSPHYYYSASLSTYLSGICKIKRAAKNRTKKALIYVDNYFDTNEFCHSDETLGSLAVSYDTWFSFYSLILKRQGRSKTTEYHADLLTIETMYGEKGNIEERNKAFDLLSEIYPNIKKEDSRRKSLERGRKYIKDFIATKEGKGLYEYYYEKIIDNSLNTDNL